MIEGMGWRVFLFLNIRYFGIFHFLFLLFPIFLIQFSPFFSIYFSKNWRRGGGGKYLQQNVKNRGLALVYHDKLVLAGPSKRWLALAYPDTPMLASPLICHIINLFVFFLFLGRTKYGIDICPMPSQMPDSLSKLMMGSSDLKPVIRWKS